MDPNYNSIDELINLLEQHNVSKIVVCPGSRNSPLVTALFHTKFFTCYPITDERSAGFFATGLSLHGGHKVAVCCTSGSALLNLHPAIAEAYYQQIPLIIISADRPLSWIGQKDGQTLPQENVFGTLVRKSINLRPINTENDRWFNNRLINEALLESDHKTRGPIHINIEIQEPLHSTTITPQPKRKIERLMGLSPYHKENQIIYKALNKYSRKMVLIGQMNLIYEFEKRDAKMLYKHFVWLGEHLANQTAPGIILRNFDAAIKSMTKEQSANFAPELLITYGGHTISKQIKKLLTEHPPKEHWHISPDGEIMDRYKCLTRVIEMDPFDFLERIAAQIDCPTPSYPREWEQQCKSLPEIEPHFSQSYIIGKTQQSLPANSALHLANSMTVRYSQLYPLNSEIEVCCNRGINGIEGSLSTALGYAYHSQKLNFIFLGDLSFFYDMNILNSTLINNNIRILLVNNNGGAIFDSLSYIDQSDEATPLIKGIQTHQAKEWATSRGFEYKQVNTFEELNDSLEWLTNPIQHNSPLFLEIICKN